MPHVLALSADRTAMVGGLLHRLEICPSRIKEVFQGCCVTWLTAKAWPDGQHSGGCGFAVDDFPALASDDLL
jgi:hypothetical protein